MATSKSREESAFSLTAGAREITCKARAASAFQEAKPAPAPARQSTDHPYTIRFWQDQVDMIREVRYRNRDRISVTDLARRAMDEYLITHASELGLTDEEAAALNAAAEN